MGEIKRQFAENGAGVGDVFSPFRVATPGCLHHHLLTYGLEDDPRARLIESPASALREMLLKDLADVAALPSMEAQTAADELIILPAACIACSGPTPGIRLFSNLQPEDIREVWTDADCGTAVGLMRVLWAEHYGQTLRIRYLRRTDHPTIDAQGEAILAVGDSAVAKPPIGYDFQFDLSHMWFEATGLPLVISLWATTDGESAEDLNDMLAASRDDGLEHRRAVTAEHAANHGWPDDLAEQIMGRNMHFGFGEAEMDGLEELYQKAAEVGVISGVKPLRFME